MLLSRRLRRSAALIDFDTAVGEDEANRILFSWDLLAYISTSIRSPVIASESSSGLLAVSHSAPETNTEQCFEVMQVSLMKDILARDFYLRSDLASRWLLDWILATRHFFERVDGHISLFDSPSTTLCSFPFPLLVDPALTVETLIVAIEQCLREPDLSLQEAGFLLLARRCRPTVFSSRYALDRLAMAVIGWLVTEEALFAAAIGGARSKRQKEVSGAAYQAIRSQITATYATRWLWKLHSLDPDAYAETLFDSLAALAVETEAATDSKEVKEERKAIFSDLLVRYMSRLAGSGALYSAFDLLFAQWLDECVEQQVRSRSEVQVRRRPHIFAAYA